MRGKYREYSAILGMYSVSNIVQDKEGRTVHELKDPTLLHIHSLASADTVEQRIYALCPEIIQYCQREAGKLKQRGQLHPSIDPVKGPWLYLCAVANNYVMAWGSGRDDGRYTGADYANSLISRTSGRGAWCK